MIDKDTLIEEIDNLLKEGSDLERTTFDGFGNRRVDGGSFKSWRPKILALFKLFLPNDDPFYLQVEVCQDNTHANLVACEGVLKNVREYLEKGLITLPLIPSNTDQISTLHPNEDDNHPILFISHCSVDKKYGDALRNYLINLGVENDRIIYTSHPLNKIPLNKSIYDYLRDKLTQRFFMIILWSNNYLESPACLNEMGALWVTKSDYTSFYTPDFSFGNPKYHQCAVDTRKMGAVLNGDKNCKASMIEFKKQIVDMFDLNNQEEEEAFYLDQFIEEITN